MESPAPAPPGPKILWKKNDSLLIEWEGGIVSYTKECSVSIVDLIPLAGPREALNVIHISHRCPIPFTESSQQKMQRLCAHVGQLYGLTQSILPSYFIGAAHFRRHVGH